VPTAKQNWSDKISSSGSGKPTRAIFHGLEGVGKTSLPAYAAKPIYMMSKGETGLLTLIDNKRVPQIAHFPETTDWYEALSQIEWLTTASHDHKTLVMDAINGFERLMHEMVCSRDYGGVWAKQGFTNYQQGFEVALADWRILLAALDRLRDEKSMSIILLCHTKVGPFKNPDGPDYDRYIPAMHQKTWELTLRWADLVGFLNFETFVEKEGSRVKGKGGQQRILYTERHAAYDAKNRLGLPAEIVLADFAEASWNTLYNAMKEARNK